MGKKSKKNSTTKPKHLMGIAILVGSIFAVMLFAYAGFDFSLGKGSFYQNQFVQRRAVVANTINSYDTKKLTACLTAKGWINTSYASKSTKSQRYCGTFPSVSALEAKPSQRECDAYKRGRTATISTHDLDYRELAAACEIIYKPIPAQPFEVELVSNLEEVNGYTYNHDVAIYRLTAPFTNDVLIDEFAIEYSVPLSDFDEIDNRAWTLRPDRTRPLLLTDLGPVRLGEDGRTRINDEILIEAGDTLEIGISLEHDLDRFSDGDTYTIELIADRLNPINHETGEAMEVEADSLLTGPVEVVVDETPTTITISRLSPEEAATEGFTSPSYDDRYCINQTIGAEHIGMIAFNNEMDEVIEINSITFRVNRDSDIYDMFNVARVLDGGSVSNAADFYTSDGSEEFTIELYRHNRFNGSARFVFFSRGYYAGEAMPDEVEGETVSFEIIDIDATSTTRELGVDLVPIPVEIADLEIFRSC